jgi:hypothetical protein
VKVKRIFLAEIVAIGWQILEFAALTVQFEFLNNIYSNANQFFILVHANYAID